MDGMTTLASLRRNLAAVEDRLTAACRRAGRRRADVTLVAVTKTVPVEAAALLPDLGVLDLGENRPQELWRKAAALPSSVRWHMIGHLQRNKIERTVPLTTLIHSVDRMSLVQALEEWAAKADRTVEVLLEANVSGEGSKQGFGREELLGAVGDLASLKRVRIRGLMTMAPLQEAEACRPVFAGLRALRDRLAADLAGVHPVEDLSMGMSNDFEVAVEEGATYVRLGTVLWEAEE